MARDTSEPATGGPRTQANRDGPVGKGDGGRGLLVHAAPAVEIGAVVLLGRVAAKMWNRGAGAVSPRRKRAAAGKESRRWLDTTARAGAVLAAAQQPRRSYRIGRATFTGISLAARWRRSRS